MAQKLTGKITNPKFKTSQVEKTKDLVGANSLVASNKTKGTSKAQKSGDNPVSVYMDKNPGDTLEPKKTGRGRGKVTQKEAPSMLKPVAGRGRAKRSTSPLPVDPQCITPNRKQEAGQRKLGIPSCLSPAVSPGSETSTKKSPRLQERAAFKQTCTPVNSKQ